MLGEYCRWQKAPESFEATDTHWSRAPLFQLLTQRREWCFTFYIVFMRQNWAHTKPSVFIVCKAEVIGRSNCHYLFPPKVGHRVFPRIAQLSAWILTWRVSQSDYHIQQPPLISAPLIAHNGDNYQLKHNHLVTISSSHTALNAWTETRGALCSSQYSLLIEWQVSVTDWANVTL